jgi:PAS domain S-box-containing protein
METNEYKPTLDKKTVIFFFFVAFALIAILVLFYYNAKKVESTSNWVEHTQQVLRKSNDVLLDVISIESSSRGFILTDNTVFLSSFDNAQKTIFTNISDLKDLTVDNPNQQLRIDLLNDFVKDKLAFTQRTIDVRKLSGMKASEELIGTGTGQVLIEKIRRIITDINIEEFRLLKIRKYNKEESTLNFDILFLLLLILITFVFILLLIIVKAQKARNKIANELSKTTDLFLNLFNYNPASIVIKRISDGQIVNVNYSFLQLYDFKDKDEVIGKTPEALGLVQDEKYVTDIDQFLKEGKMVKDYETSIRTSKGELKWTSDSVLLLEVDNEPCLFSVSIDTSHRKKIEEQLMIATKEMEAFTYSVSHDLRAPLRAINGYAKIIQEDYAEALKDDGMNSLNAIMNNSRKMGELIDDLLAFSRLGRKVVETSEIIMSSLVTSVRDEELVGNTANIEITIHELHPALGQQALIKQVWVNLISNAIKYSKHKAKSIIEIGSYYKGNKVVYYVKDNGAGFDMQYYDKLFGVFQRLHSQEEFEGTGIGLAIVQKIVTRNNGAVWAEAKVDEGACFYFSLPKIKE